jgi:hypothetical protein
MSAVQQLKDNLARKSIQVRMPAYALALLAMVALTAKTCSADTPMPGSGSATIHSCSPNYTDENKLGRLSIQQKGPGTSIQWGVYPALDAAWFRVRVYVGGDVVDGKNQAYPPHGSLPPRDKRGRRTYHTGQVFKITGTSYASKGGAVVQKFYIKCRLV